MTDWDIAVIGGGGAGLAAAVSAAQQGARVVLFESQHELGGSTQLSAGMFTAAGTSVQHELGLDDTPEKFFQHYMDLNQWKLKPGLVRAFCTQAASTFEWLLELGVEVPAKRSGNAHTPGLCQAGVEDVWRGHVPVDQGYGLVQVLSKQAREHGVEVVLDSPVERLIVQGGRVTGLVTDNTALPVDAVVVASGGLASNPALVREFYPDALKAGDSGFVVATSGAQGDHLRFAESANANIVGQGWGLLLITASFQRFHHWQSGFPPASRVYLNEHGHRFMNEDASYAVAEGIFARQGGRVWSIFDQSAVDSLREGYADWTPERLEWSINQGRSHRRHTLEELLQVVGLPHETSVAAIRRWNEQLPNGHDPDFLRHETLANKGMTGPVAPIGTSPFYAVEMLPGELVCTHAGIEISEHAEALDQLGQVIPGLFAAGEAGAGILGERYVGGGNSVANALTMGRAAGLSASRVLDS